MLRGQARRARCETARAGALQRLAERPSRRLVRRAAARPLESRLSGLGYELWKTEKRRLEKSQWNFHPSYLWQTLPWKVLRSPAESQDLGCFPTYAACCCISTASG